jgi:PhnB protein
VTPYLAVKGAMKALEWYRKAFGAKVLDREEVEGGMLMHARMRIGDSIIMMSDIFPGALHRSPLDLGAASVTLHVYTKNVDELWKRAVEAGATVNMPLDDMFWGERYGQLTDPFGHSWSLSKRIPMSKKEMDHKRQEAMKMFEQNEHLGYQE